MTNADEYRRYAAQRQLAIRERYPTQLPLYPEDRQAVPTDFVRSALFTARHGRDVEKVDRTIIASEEGVELDYSGWILTQAHARVWEALVDACRRAKALDYTFRGSHFARRLSATGSVGKSQRLQLRKLLLQLAQANISIRHLATGISLHGLSMIQLVDNNNDCYVASIAPGIVTLFHESRVHIDPTLDLTIQGRLAQWLYRYFCTTAKPIRVIDVKRLSDSRTKELRDFRKAVWIALEELGERAVLKKWAIDQTDTVNVEPTCSPRLFTTGSNGHPLLLPGT